MSLPIRSLLLHKRRSGIRQSLRRQDNWKEPRSALIDHKSPQIQTVGALVLLHLWSSRFSYVEKKTCECAVQAARVADTPWTIGAGLQEIGFTLASFTSSCSILRCSWGWGRLFCVMDLFSHSVGRKEKSPPNASFTSYSPSSAFCLVKSLRIVRTYRPHVRLLSRKSWSLRTTKA